jgi:hypothetical protein
MLLYLIFPVEGEKRRIQMIDDQQRPMDGGVHLRPTSG